MTAVFEIAVGAFLLIEAAALAVLFALWLVNGRADVTIRGFPWACAAGYLGKRLAIAGVDMIERAL